MTMNTADLQVDASHGPPPRKKRRPALACEQCRRRKIKCDRRSPCQPCVNANIEKCQYLHDTRSTLKNAPFEAQDTQFSVFEQRERPYTATTASTATQSTPSEGFFSGSTSETGSLVSLQEQDISWTSSIMSPVAQPLELDLDLSSMLESPVCPPQPKQFSPPNLYPEPDAGALPGVLFKSRFHGQSHWTNYASQSSAVMTAIQAHENLESNHSRPTYVTCKAISRAIKSQEPAISEFTRPIRDLVPGRAISNRLVQAYLRTFQTVFGIIHVPTFRDDYQALWLDSRPVDEAFGIILLLMMCIGSTFSSPETSVSKSTIQRWSHVASSWLKSSKDKAKLTLDGLRIQSLYLLACQTSSVKRDITSLSTGTLLRSAMHTGIHIDAEKQPSLNINPHEAESRRRLWATILELELQSSMDYGSLPLVNSDDYNCGLPLNVDNTSLDTAKATGERPQPKPIDQFTQSSFQILLARTIPTRLKIAKFINGVAPSSSYETVISLNTELSTALTDCYNLIEGYKISCAPPTAFQTKLFDLFVQRFVLGLHHPFAIKAMSNPSYFYSRKLCLGTALALFAPPGEEFHQLLLHGSGLFRDVFTQAALYMCGELIDDSEAAQLFPFNPVGTFACEEMRKATSKYLALAAARMDAGERSIKRFVLVSCLLAQADVAQAGASRERKIAAALGRTLGLCHEKLIKQLRAVQEELHQARLGMGTVGVGEGARWDDLMGIGMGGGSP